MAKRTRWMSMWGVVLVSAGLGIASGAPARKPATTSTRSGPVATVGTLTIPRDEFESRMQEIDARYRARAGGSMTDEERPLVRRQVLEMLIRQRLLMLEAEQHTDLVPPAQVEAQLQRDPVFQANGRFDPARYAQFKASQPDEYRRVARQVRGEMGARALAERLQREATPDPGPARLRQARKLMLARVGFLPLRFAEFDGGYPEPTEAEVLAASRARAAEPGRQRPEELRISIIRVNTPPITDEAMVRTDLREAWEQQMLRRADSLIAAVRAGGSFDRAADAFGGARRARVPRGGQPPEPWRGNDRDLAQLWATAPGGVVAHAFPADVGRLVIRVDQKVAPGPAPVADVARDVRDALRREARVHREDRELAQAYAALKDSLRGPGPRVLYAAFETGAMAVPAPSEAELERWYRAHLADYSTFDAASGKIHETPFASIRDEVRARWLGERRTAALRDASEKLLAAWLSGRRDAALERRATFVRDLGGVPPFAVVDTGLAGSVLTDSLRATGFAPGAGLAAYPRGAIVFRVLPPEGITQATPAQARPLLETWVARRRIAEEERGARALYDRDPGRFRVPRTIHMTRLFAPLPDPLQVALTRPQVEAFYQANLRDYSAEELVRARHILIVPRDASAAAVEEAHRRAMDVARRARDGEDFTALARQYSEDVATRNQGGDVGVFRRGMMLDEFERAAWRMRPGEISDPVRTEVGFHVIQCTEHMAPEVTPLNYCYANVGFALAQQVAREQAHARADSLRRSLRTVADARRVAATAMFPVMHDAYVPGEMTVPRDLSAFFTTLEKLPAGAIHPQVGWYGASGWAVAWVDSITPARPGSWDQVRTRAIEVYRSEANRRAVRAKAAELDSMARAGWSLDSLASLWGGLESRELPGPGTPLPQLGGGAIVDSLVFGGRNRPPALKEHDETPWIEFPTGYARLRLDVLQEPQPAQLEARVQADVQAEAERNLRLAYEKLKAKYPVRILDSQLADTPLPPATEP